MCASELTLTGVDGDRFALSERLVYRPWMCLETTLTVRMSADRALEVEQSPEPDLCCRGTLAYVGAAKPADPIAEPMTIAGLGRTTSSAALGGATTQYVGTGAGSLWFPLEDTGQVARVDAASGEVEALIDVGDPAVARGHEVGPARRRRRRRGDLGRTGGSAVGWADRPGDERDLDVDPGERYSVCARP